MGKCAFAQGQKYSSGHRRNGVIDLTFGRTCSIILTGKQQYRSYYTFLQAIALTLKFTENKIAPQNNTSRSQSGSNQNKNSLVEILMVKSDEVFGK